MSDDAPLDPSSDPPGGRFGSPSWAGRARLVVPAGAALRRRLARTRAGARGVGRADEAGRRRRLVAAGAPYDVPADVVVRAVGCRGLGLPGVPFDESGALALASSNWATWPRRY